MQFKRFFSLDSPKAIKARQFGYLNAINYMAPANLAGQGNMCPHASPGCLALCLGWHSGQAGMVKGGRVNAMNDVRRSRVAKVRMFMTDRRAFIRELIQGVRQAQRAAEREGLRLCVRLNGATDIAWERQHDDDGFTIFSNFPDVQFVDYTKNVERALQFAWLTAPRGRRVATGWPPNYHLTFSRSETNEEDCRRVLEAGGNVAVVFAGPLPDSYLGYRVVDGDAHDLRHLDAIDEDGNARGACVIGLSPKGTRAKRDKSGFVVRG